MSDLSNQGVGEARRGDTVHILDRIVETKRLEVAELTERADALAQAARDAAPPRDFGAALRRTVEVALVAEVKRRSPGAGTIRTDLDPAAQARAYEAGGAAAVSVLTDATYFSGSLADLETVKGAIELPVLRKDFIIDPLQIVEARASGADAVLLIVRILDDETLASLHALALDLGMSVLVEAHSAGELDRALQAGARILGINNRDLSTFQTRIEVTLELLDRVPAGATVISESGIGGSGDVDRLGAAGVDAVLVGEWLMRQDGPIAAAAALSRRSRSARVG